MGLHPDLGPVLDVREQRDVGRKDHLGRCADRAGLLLPDAQVTQVLLEAPMSLCSLLSAKRRMPPEPCSATGGGAAMTQRRMSAGSMLSPNVRIG